ncbi:MAG: hypothetical protein NT025_05105 [bacterium]|nr:hypothetical protein [bacterium]
MSIKSREGNKEQRHAEGWAIDWPSWITAGAATIALVFGVLAIIQTNRSLQLTASALRLSLETDLRPVLCVRYADGARSDTQWSIQYKVTNTGRSPAYRVRSWSTVSGSQILDETLDLSNAYQMIAPNDTASYDVTKTLPPERNDKRLSFILFVAYEYIFPQSQDESRNDTVTYVTVGSSMESGSSLKYIFSTEKRIPHGHERFKLRCDPSSAGQPVIVEPVP